MFQTNHMPQHINEKIVVIGCKSNIDKHVIHVIPCLHIVVNLILIH